MTDDGQTGIHWVSDEIIGREYVALSGASQEGVADILRRHLSFYGLDDVRHMVRTDLPWYDQVPVLHAVAAGGPPVRDDAIVELIDRSLNHEHSAVRNAAMVASAYLGWPDLRPFLVVAREFDPDPELRTLADQLLASFDDEGPR